MDRAWSAFEPSTWNSSKASRHPEGGRSTPSELTIRPSLNGYSAACRRLTRRGSRANAGIVSLRHAAEYPFNDGRIVSSDGVDLPPSGWRDAFEEFQVEGSNALHARSIYRKVVYLLGPAARVVLAGEQLHPLAKEALATSGFAELIRTNIYASIVARAVELVHAFAEAIDIIDAYRVPSEPLVAWQSRPGVAAWATEAPRGLLFHRYEVDESGRIRAAQIVPPTSQNQAAIEADLVVAAKQVLDLPHAEATLRLEQMIRSYDPCISCATHFLDLRVEEA